MSTFDPTARVNAISHQAETAKGLIDKLAKDQADAAYAAFNPAPPCQVVMQQINEIWEHARKQKNAVNEKATADINEVWADWNEAEAKERKRKKK